jgi:hypothetical protein
MTLAIIENLYLEKPSFRPSKWPRKLKPAKNSKLPKLPESCFEPVGKGGWPPISTWINLAEGIQQLQQRIADLELCTVPETLQDVRDRREGTVERINSLAME